MSNHSDWEAQIEAIVDGYLEELRNGSPPELAELVARHPEIAEELESRLRMAANLKRIFREQLPSTNINSVQSKVARANRIRCPHCGNHFRVIDASMEVLCRTCGSSFVPTKDLTWNSASAPVQLAKRFEIIRELGSGAFGTVYKALDKTLKRIVAVKIPRRGTFLNSTEEHRFIREAQSAARLSHPGIVPVHDIGTGDSVYIVSEYIHGMTLSDLISGTAVDFRQTAEIIAAVCDALDYAHSKNIIHRDVKPGNILLDENQRPHLADFGLARCAEPEITMTQEGEIVGTPAFMSPEQASAEHSKVDRRSDVYSVGVTLFRMLCGELPFRGSQRMLLHQILYEDPPRPRKFNENVPRDLETIALKAMEKGPNLRYQSAKELADELRRWLAGDPIRARPPGFFERCWKWCRKRPVVSALTGLISLLAITIVVGSVVSAYRELGLRRAAESAKKASHFSLASSLIQQGLAVDEDSPAQSLPFFAESLAVHQSISNEQETGELRMRIDHTLRALPRLTHLQDMKDRVDSIVYNSTSGKTYVAAGMTVTSFVGIDFAQQSSLPVGNRSDQIEISRDGSRMVTLPHATGNAGVNAVTSPLVSQSAQLWNLENNLRVATLQHSGFVLAAEFSPDGKTVATTARDGVKIWSAYSGELLKEILLDNKYATRLAFLEDSPSLVAHVLIPGQLNSSRVVVWDTNNWKTFEFEHGPNIRQMKVEGGILWTAGVDGTAREWTLADGALKSEFVHTSELLGLQVIDKQFLLTHTSQGDSTLWDRKSNNPVHAPFKHRDINSRVFAYAGDQSYFVTGTDRNLDVVWTEAGNRLCPTVPATSRPSAVAVGSDNRILIVGEANGLLRVWDLAGVTRLARLLLNEKGEVVVSPKYSNDGRVLSVIAGNELKLGDMQSGRWVNITGEKPIVANCLDPSGLLLASSDTEGKLLIHEAATGRLIMELKNTSGPLVTLEFNPSDKNMLVAAGADGSVAIWSLKTGEVVALYKHQGAVRSIAIHAENQMLASGGNDKTIRLFDLKSLAEVANPRTDRSEVVGLQFSNNGDLLLSSSRAWTSLWDLQNQEPLFRSRKPIGNVSNAIFSRDDQTFLGCNIDAKLCERFVASPNDIVHTFEDASVGWVELFPIRELVVTSASNDNESVLQISSRKTRLPVVPGFKLRGYVRVAISPDGKSIVAASRNGQVWNWKLAESVLSLACLRQYYIVLTGKRYRDGSLWALAPSEIEATYQMFKVELPSESTTTVTESMEWNDRLRKLRVGK